MTRRRYSTLDELKRDIVAASCVLAAVMLGAMVMDTRPAFMCAAKL
jgi:hypothetical protein